MDVVIGALHDGLTPESTKTTCQLDVTQSSFITQKQLKWLLSDVWHSVWTRLTKGAVILQSELKDSPAWQSESES